MQFKQTLLALSLTVAAMPVLPAFDASTYAERNGFNAANKSVTLEHINAAHVTKAQQAIANEATWAKPVRYAMIGTAVAAVGYGMYRWLYAPKAQPAEKSIINMSENGHKFFKDLAETDQATITKNLKANLKQLREGFQEAAKAEYANQSWFTTIGNALYSSGGVVATQIGILAAAQGVQYGFNTIAPYIPSTGTMHWYLAARTDYDRNLNDAMRYLSFYELFQDEIGDVIGLITLDMEKALGYLGYFEQLLVEQKSPEYILTQCTRYRTNIEVLTNNLVDAMNTNAPMADVMNKVRLLDAEVRSAKGFVSANYN